MLTMANSGGTYTGMAVGLGGTGGALGVGATTIAVTAVAGCSAVGEASTVTTMSTGSEGRNINAAKQPSRPDRVNNAAKANRFRCGVKFWNQVMNLATGVGATGGGPRHGIG